MKKEITDMKENWILEGDLDEVKKRILRKGTLEIGRRSGSS